MMQIRENNWHEDVNTERIAHIDIDNLIKTVLIEKLMQCLDGESKGIFMK